MHKLRSLLSKQSYYIKMLLFYSVFLSIVVISSSYILINYSNNHLEKEINKSNKRLLAQVKILSDSYMLDKLNSLMNEKFINLSKDNDINDFFSYNYVDRNDLYLRILSNLSSIALNFDYIDSIYFYRKADNLLISSKEGMIFSALDPDNKYKDYINTQLIEETMSSVKSQSWFSPLDNAEFGKDKPFISFAQSLPMFAPMQERTGCVIININQEYFFGSINKISDSDTGDIMIIDSNVNLFAHSDRTKLFSPFVQTDEIKQINQSDEGFLISNVDMKRTGISWIKSSINDWKYISLVPIDELNKNVFIVRQFMIILAAAITFFSLLGLNLITSYLYKPFKEFIRASKEKFNIRNVSNEFHLIDSIISNLSLQVEEMEVTFKKNQGLLEYKLAIDILHGNIKNNEEVKSRLQLADKEFPYEYLSLIITEINHKIFSQLNSEQREFILFKLIDLINAYFDGKCRCISVCVSSNCVVTIINLPTKMQDLPFDLKQLIQIMVNELSLTCNMAVSELTNNLLLLNTIYSNTMNYLKYSFIYGYGNIFSNDIIEKYELNDGDFSLDTLKHLEILLKSCKYDQLRLNIGKIAEDIKTKGYSYNYAQTVLIQIASLICKTIREQSPTNDAIKKNDITFDFNNIFTLSESIDWIYKLIDLYSQNISVRNSNIDYEFLERIINFIAENIDKQISLNTIADEFNISTGHLSRLFKEGTGISFSDYIIDLKFKKAAELLAESKLEVSEIAAKLGYLQLSYFSKLFKEKFGMTPIQYRKKNIHAS